MTGHQITPEVEQFLAEQPNLILATLRKEGGPQLSPVWFVYRDDAFFISTMTTTAKWANLNRDPHCSGIVDDPEGQYVYVSGVAELTVEPHPFGTTQEIIHRYKSPEEFDSYMESIFERGKRGIIRLQPERIVTREFD